MSSTYSDRSQVVSRNIRSGKSCNWLFCKCLSTNNQNYCQLHDEREIDECVLKDRIPDIEYRCKENKNNKQ